MPPHISNSINNNKILHIFIYATETEAAQSFENGIHVHATFVFNFKKNKIKLRYENKTMKMNKNESEKPKEFISEETYKEIITNELERIGTSGKFVW